MRGSRAIVDKVSNHRATGQCWWRVVIGRAFPSGGNRGEAGVRRRAPRPITVRLLPAGALRLAVARCELADLAHGVPDEMLAKAAAMRGGALGRAYIRCM